MINQFLKKYVYKDPKNNTNVCAVCLSSVEYDNDILHQCSVCLEFTHQTCYGSDLLNKAKNDDKNPWSCQRCQVFLKNDIKEEDINSNFLNKIR